MLPYVKVLVAPTLCDPLDCGLSGSSVHGILQTRILEWVVVSFSRESSQCRDRAQVSRIGRWILYRETLEDHTVEHIVQTGTGLKKNTKRPLCVTERTHMIEGKTY